GAIQRVAERLRGSGNVVEQPDKPEVRVARQSEAEGWIVQCFGCKLQKPDLARNADALVFVVYLTGRQTGASQQRLEDNARLAQASCGQARRGYRISLCGRTLRSAAGAGSRTRSSTSSGNRHGRHSSGTCCEAGDLDNSNVFHTGNLYNSVLPTQGRIPL